MKLQSLDHNYSPYFVRDDRPDRVEIPNNVKLVVGTKAFNCSGVILGKRSTVLLELILKQSEIYLDAFTECLEGLLDAIDLLYGAEVVVSMENIQALLKFSLMYEVDELATLSFHWVTNQMSMENLFTFCRMGLFIKSVDVDRDDILINCKDFIRRSAVDDLIEAGKCWPEDQNVTKFLIDQDLMPMTIPIITNWIVKEKGAVLVLDRIEDGALQETLTKLPRQVLSNFCNAMQDACETVPSLKRVCKLQSALIGQEQSLSFDKIQVDSKTILKSLEPKLWRNFDVNQMLLLHYHYGITDFFFAEVLLDWISFKKPSQNIFDQLWGLVKTANMGQGYMTVLGNSVKLHRAGLVLPAAEVGASKYNMLNYPDSDDIVNTLTDPLSSLTVALRDKECRIKDCTFPNHYFRLKLSDAIPCYQLGTEGPYEEVHYHHDRLKHWFATEEKNGQRVLLSLVTNNMETVIKKVKAAKDIQINVLYT